jgi:hypothetical protein
VRSTSIPQSVSDLLDDFRASFTRPGFANFTTMVVGWIICSGRHSVSRVIQAAGELGGSKHHSSHYRFLSCGRWCTDTLGKMLFRRLLRYVPGQVGIAIDDTLCHKGGPHIFGAAMHFDSRASTYGRGTTTGRKGCFAFGHNWVVVSLWIPLPWNQDRGLAIPFLWRIYRSKKRCPEHKYRKRTVIASEMIKIVASWVPSGRMLSLVGDSEYACKTVVRNLPDNVLFTGPMCMDAALHELPPSYAGKGRPCVVGKRLPSPKKLAASKSRWRKLTLVIYGRTVTLNVKSMRCLWHTVAGPRLVQVVVTRDPTGRINDRAYFSTVDHRDEQADTLHDPVAAVLMEFARRWEIEVAFRNTKQAMGLEDPQNGWWRRKAGSPRPRKRPGPNAKEKVGETAVNHTLACAFVAYAITIMWYLEHGQAEQDVARARREAPWYRHKAHPSFADMLAAIRRELWTDRLSRHPRMNLGREQLDAILPQWHLAA